MVRDMIREGKPYREVIEFIRERHFMNMIFEEGLRQVLLGNTAFEELRDLPRGDYVMKVPQEIMRDATETAETRRVDLPNAPKELTVPPVPERIKGAIDATSVMAAKPMAYDSTSVKPETPAINTDFRLTNASVDRILSNSKLRNQLIVRLLEMGEDRGEKT